MMLDIRLALRLLRARPRFALAVALLLALGIGPNVAIFSVVYAVLVRPLPFDRGEQIVYVWETAPAMGLPRSAVSPANFGDWRERSTVFQQMAAFRTWFYTVAGDDEPEQVWGVRVSASFSGTALGLAAALVVARLLEGLLFGITPMDPATYAAAGVFFVTIASGACWIPARQATKVDPSVALRCE